MNGPYAQYQNKVMGSNKPWYAIRNQKEKSVDISIYDEIGWWGTRAKELAGFIRGLAEDCEINLHIFSPGGSVFEGNEIANSLTEHKGKVNVTLGALCASIATAIALAGDTISMPKNGKFLIHNPSVCTYGEAKDLRKTADLMDSMKDDLVAIYVAKTGKPADQIKTWMDDETIFNSKDALDHGFVDSIRDATSEDEDEEKAVAKFDLSSFKNSATLSPATSAPEVPEPIADGNVNDPPTKPATAGQSLLNQYRNKKVRIFAIK